MSVMSNLPKAAGIIALVMFGVMIWENFSGAAKFFVVFAFLLAVGCIIYPPLFFWLGKLIPHHNLILVPGGEQAA